MSFRVLGPRILIDPVTSKPKMPEGLIAPDNLGFEAEVSGTVVGVGSIKGEINVGDVVFFSPHAGQECVVEGKRQIIIREEQILAVVEQE